MSSGRVKAFTSVAVAAIIIGVLWAGSRSPTLPGSAASMAGLAGAESLQGQPTHQEYQDVRVQLAKQEDALVRFTARMVQLEYELRAERARTSAGPDQYADADEPPRMTSEQFEEMVRVQEEEIIEKDRQRIAAIESGWITESVDPYWAAPYEHDVLTAVSSADIESVSLMDVNCRYSVCKLEFTTDPTVNPQALTLNLVDLEPFQNTEFTTTTPEGGDPGQIIVYLARPGGEGLSHLYSNP